MTPYDGVVDIYAYMWMCNNNIKSFDYFKTAFVSKVPITIVQPLIKYVGIQSKYDYTKGFILCKVRISLNICLNKPSMKVS